LQEGIRLEAGVESVPVAIVKGLDGGWLLGRAGFRFGMLRLREGRTRPNSWAGWDIEVGVGAGWGGEHRETEDNDTFGRLAGGAYLGTGIGYHLAESFALFARVREQLTSSEGIPTTLWTSALGGAEIVIGPIAIHLAGGLAEYRNSVDQGSGATIELGLSGRIGGEDE